MLESTLFVICWAITSVALLVTIARLIIRYQQRVGFFADDALALVGAILLLALCLCHTFMIPTLYLSAAVQAGDIMPPADYDSKFVKMLRLQFSALVVFWCCLWSAKLSLMFFIKRVIKGLPNLILVWYMVLAFISINFAVGIISTFLLCKNFNSNFVLGAGNCANQPGGLSRLKALFYLNTVADAVTDLSIMAIPLYVIWTLRVNLKQKLGLALMFCLGVTCIAISIVRAVEFFQPETVRNHGWLAMWTQVLAAVAVIISCLPVVQIAYKRPLSSASKAYSHKPSLQTSSPIYSARTSRKVISSDLPSTGYIAPPDGQVEMVYIEARSILEALKMELEDEEQQQFQREQDQERQHKLQHENRSGQQTSRALSHDASSLYSRSQSPGDEELGIRVYAVDEQLKPTTLMSTTSPTSPTSPTTTYTISTDYGIMSPASAREAYHFDIPTPTPTTRKTSITYAIPRKDSDAYVPIDFSIIDDLPWDHGLRSPTTIPIDRPRLDSDAFAYSASDEELSELSKTPLSPMTPTSSKHTHSVIPELPEIPELEGTTGEPVLLKYRDKRLLSDNESY